MTKTSADPPPPTCQGPDCDRLVPLKPRSRVGTAPPRGRPQRYCSQACRQRAYRARHAPSTAELQREALAALDTVTRRAGELAEGREDALRVLRRLEDAELTEVARTLAGAAASLETLAHTLARPPAPAANNTAGSVTPNPVTPTPAPAPVSRAPARPAARADGFTPTAEQEAIVAACTQDQHLVIEAGAGTGKTSTLKLAATAMPERTGLYVAFNRSIAAEAKKSMPSNVTASTAHSLAFQAVGKRYKHRLDGPRVPARDAAKRLGITSPLAMGEVRLSEAKQAALAAEMLGRFCHSAERDLTVAHVPFVHGITREQSAALARHLLPLAERIWEDVQQVQGGHFKFGHDHYLKLWQLSGPSLGADFVLFDEAQDANPVIADIIQSQTGTQQIAVGDACQAIYGWRGAVDAMATWPAQTHLYLSKSFRFGPAIAEEANTWLDELSARLRLEGNEHKHSTVGRTSTPTAVLCRTNATALGKAMDAMGGGQRAALVGGGSQIQRLAEAALELQGGRGTSHPELFAFRSWSEVQSYVREEPEAAGELATLVRLIDDHGPTEVITATRRLADERRADVVFSTAHKAKGREWSSVQIADDFREPKPDRTTGEPGPVPRAEAMLAYVAVTRAMDHLNNTGLSWIHHRTRGEDVVRRSDAAYGFDGT